MEQLSHAVATLGAYHLAGLSPLVTIGGSLLARLAVLEKALSAGAGLGRGDGRRPLAGSEQWGADAEAEAALENRGRDFFAAARFWSCWTPSSSGARRGAGRSRVGLLR